MWVTQMNHIVMDIDREPYRDWFSSQVRAAGADHHSPVSIPNGPCPGLGFPGAACVPLPGTTQERVAGLLGGTCGEILVG